MKLCKDCNNILGDDSIFGSIYHSFCKKDKFINPVTGIEQYMPCYITRGLIDPKNAKCGNDAKLFESIEEIKPPIIEHKKTWFDKLFKFLDD